MRKSWIACLLATACGMGIDTGANDTGDAGSAAPDAGALPDGGVSDAGVGDAGTTPAATQHAWLDPQNAARAHPTPAPASPMPAMTWSESAAQFAQGWANRCVYEHSTTAQRGNRGENIAATAQSGRPASTIGDAVKLWTDEGASYTYSTGACSANDCGHYTQIVWASTLRVGCATTHCTTGSPFQDFTEWDFWVCDYEPPGNFVGQKPY